MALNLGRGYRWEMLEAPLNTELDLGETRVPVCWHPASSKGGCAFINLHENERTSVQAAKRVLADADANGALFHFRAGGQRRLRFVSAAGRDETLEIDPNRVFCDVGIERSLGLHNSSYPALAVEEIGAFRQSLLALWQLQLFERVVALHNTGDEFCIHSFAPGGPEENCVADLHVEVEQPRHDFFFVTEQSMFDGLAARGFSVVLQRQDHLDADGSLSVYCAERGLPYVNVEARYGAVDSQVAMLRAVLDVAQSAS